MVKVRVVIYLNPLTLHEGERVCENTVDHMFNCTLFFKYHSGQVQEDLEEKIESDVCFI